MTWIKLFSENKIDIRTVKPGDRVGNLWIIDEGLNPGERVVTEGVQKVRPGTPVTPNDMNGGEARGGENTASHHARNDDREGRPKADPSLYANDARGLANIYHLDFLELVAGDGTLISSAQSPLLSRKRLRRARVQNPARRLGRPSRIPESRKRTAGDIGQGTG